MSSPESVSSKIANRGFSSSSWTISCRFFSPPEKPSLRLRLAKSGSIWTRSIDFLHPGPQLRRLAIERCLRRTQKVGHRNTGHFNRILHGQEQASPGPLVDREREQVLTVEGHAA